MQTKSYFNFESDFAHCCNSINTSMRLAFLVVICLGPSYASAQDKQTIESLDQWINSLNLDDLRKDQQPDSANNPVSDNLSKSTRALDTLPEIAEEMRLAAQLLGTSTTSPAKSFVEAVVLQDNILLRLEKILAAQANGSLESSTQSQPQLEDMDRRQTDGGNERVDEPNSSEPSPENTDAYQQLPTDSSSSDLPSDNSKSGSNENNDALQSSENSDRNFGNQSGNSNSNPNEAEPNINLRQSMLDSTGTTWGSLPERLRSQLNTVRNFGFTPGFELQTKDYFEKLNEALNSR